jgi:hypothetical protein
VEPEFRIKQWPVQRCKNLTTRSDGHGTPRWINESITDGLRGLIGASGGDRNSCGQSQLLGGALTQPAHDACGRKDFWENRSWKPESIDDFVGPGPHAHIEDLACIALVRAAYGQPEAKVVFRHQELGIVE